MRDKARLPFNAMEQHSSERPHGARRGGDAEDEQARVPPLVDLHHRMGNGAIQLMSRRAMANQAAAEQRPDVEALTLEQLAAEPGYQPSLAQDIDANRENVLSSLAEALESRY